MRIAADLGSGHYNNELTAFNWDIPLFIIMFFGIFISVCFFLQIKHFNFATIKP
jgi:hypothetical protein